MIEASLVFLLAILACSSVSAVIHYVDLDSPSPNPPYTNWMTAAANIQDAVNATVDGDSVIVTNGHYYLTSEIMVTSDITIESVNGRDRTYVLIPGSHQVVPATCENVFG